MTIKKQALVHIPVELVERAAALWPKLRLVPEVAALAPRESGAGAVRYALRLGLAQLEGAPSPAPAEAGSAAEVSPTDQPYCQNCGEDIVDRNGACARCSLLQARLAEAERARDTEPGYELASLMAGLSEYEIGVSAPWMGIRGALGRWRKAQATVEMLRGQLEARRQAAMARPSEARSGT